MSARSCDHVTTLRMGEDARVGLEDLRLAVYRWFARTGRPPRAGDLAGRLALDVATVRAGLAEFARARHLVLDQAGQVVMAHPFSAVPLGFAVMGRQALWWGGRAWDSFALPQVLPDEDEVLVSTRCPACSRPHAWNVGTERPPDGDQVAHFLVPAAHMWDDVVHTCRHQRLFCSEQCVNASVPTERIHARLRHGSAHAVAVRLPLVRRTPGPRLRQASAGSGDRVPAKRGTLGPVLGPVTRLANQQ
jgi:Alkylmercury lyase